MGPFRARDLYRKDGWRVMPDGRASVFETEGSRYILAGADVQRVMSVFCCTLRRAALNGVISLPFWCTFGRAALGGKRMNILVALYKSRSSSFGWVALYGDKKVGSGCVG